MLSIEAVTDSPDPGDLENHEIKDLFLLARCRRIVGAVVGPSSCRARSRPAPVHRTTGGRRVAMLIHHDLQRREVICISFTIKCTF